MSDNNRSSLKIAVIVFAVFAVAGWGLYLKDKGVVQQLEANLSKTKNALETVQSDKDTLTTSLAASQEHGRALTSEIHNIQAKNSNLDDQLNSAQSQLQQQQNTLKQGQETRDRLDNELKALVQQRQLLESQLDDSKQHLQQESVQLTQTRVQIEIKEQALSEVQNHLIDLSNKLSSSMATIASLNNEIIQLNLLRQQEAESFTRLKNGLEAQIANHEVEIRSMQDRITVIAVGAKTLFRSGSANLSNSGRKVLDDVIALLKKLPNRQISVEGHTDNIPVGKNLIETYNSNWELSSHRAAAAVRYLQFSGIDPRRMQVVGFGEYQPVADNLNQEGQARNRRIEIRLRPGDKVLPIKMIALDAK